MLEGAFAAGATFAAIGLVADLVDDGLAPLLLATALASAILTPAVLDDAVLASADGLATADLAAVVLTLAGLAVWILAAGFAEAVFVAAVLGVPALATATGFLAATSALTAPDFFVVAGSAAVEGFAEVFLADGLFAGTAALAVAADCFSFFMPNRLGSEGRAGIAITSCLVLDAVSPPTVAAIAWRHSPKVSPSDSLICRNGQMMTGNIMTRDRLNFQPHRRLLPFNG